MATNQSRREVLRFYRIRTRGTAFVFNILGYRNKPQEYARWNDDLLDSTGQSTDGKTATELGYQGPSPKKFLTDRNFLENAEFIIANVFEPYDRTKHDLSALISSIWIITAGTDNLVGVNAVNQNESRLVSQNSPVVEVLEFFVNPNSINIVKRKLFQKLRTRGGWAFQHWGPDIGEIQLDGVTRNITPPPQTVIGPPEGNDRGPQPNRTPETIAIPTEVNSPALKAFRLLERWYDEDQSEKSQRDGLLLALEYRGRIYVGHLREFSHGEQNNRPFLLVYKLAFVVHYDSGALGDATFRAQSRIIRNQATIAHIKAIKDSTIGEDNAPSG